jgi:hypothetical protein
MCIHCLGHLPSPCHPPPASPFNTKFLMRTFLFKLFIMRISIEKFCFFQTIDIFYNKSNIIILSILLWVPTRLYPIIMFNIIISVFLNFYNKASICSFYTWPLKIFRLPMFWQRERERESFSIFLLRLLLEIELPQLE